MRWMAWNTLGCALWLAGLAYVKGMDLIGPGVVVDGHQIVVGLACGLVGLALLMWVNLIDVS